MLSVVFFFFLLLCWVSYSSSSYYHAECLILLTIMLSIVFFLLLCWISLILTVFDQTRCLIDFKLPSRRRKMKQKQKNGTFYEPKFDNKCRRRKDATTLNIMTINIMTLNIMTLSLMTLVIMYLIVTFSINDSQHSVRLSISIKSRMLVSSCWVWHSDLVCQVSLFWVSVGWVSWRL
jgi:hypothetical protein